MAPDDVLTDKVYAELKRDIHQGRLGAGERLIERSIAQSKRVSRTPVREALRRLRSEGLTQYMPHRGFVVAELSSEDIDEIYVLRETLEGLAIRETALRADARAVDGLYALLPPMERAAAAGRIEEMRRLNRAFHDRIIELSGMRHVLELVTQLGDRIEHFRRQSLSLPGRPNHTLEEHRLIVDNLRENDPDLAEAAMRLHIRRAREAARLTLGLPRQSGQEEDAEGGRPAASRHRRPADRATPAQGRPRPFGAAASDSSSESEGGE